MINAFAQNIDSLKNALKTESIDTNKVNIYNTLAYDVIYDDPLLAEKYLIKAIALSEKSNFKHGLEESWFIYANIENSRGNKVETVRKLKIALTFSEQLNNTPRMGTILNNIATLLSQEGKLIESIDEFQKALTFAKAVKDTTSICYILYNIGSIYKDLGDKKKGFDYILASGNIGVQFKDPYILPLAYSNLGVVASYNGNDLKAIEYEEIGLKYALETKDMLSVFYAYQSIGQYSLALDNIKAADKNLKSAYKVASTIGDTTLIMEIFIDFSKFHQSKKNYKKAIDYAKKAETLLAKIGTKNFYTKAVNLQLAESYADIKNYEAAYEYLDKHRIINDTLVSKDNRQLSANMEALYRTNEKETENKKLRIQQAKNEVTIQKRTLLGIVLTLGLVLLLSIAAWLFYNNRKKQSYNRELEKQVRQRTSELQKANNDLEQANYELRTFNYIASHDIKEPIRVIGNYAGLAFRKLPQDLKESLGEYFDTIKRSTAQLYTLIEDFARYTTMSKNETIETKAVNLNSLSLSVVDNLQESIEKYNGQVLIADLPIIPSSNSLLFTTLKNLIENGLKYNKSDKPTVNINYRKTISHHEIIVSDNGIGIEEQYHEKIFEMFKRLHSRVHYEGSGIGLAIVKLSIHKLDGTVELKSKKNEGTKFYIKLPLK